MAVTVSHREDSLRLEDLSGVLRWREELLPLLLLVVSPQVLALVCLSQVLGLRHVGDALTLTLTVAVLELERLLVLTLLGQLQLDVDEPLLVGLVLPVLHVARPPLPLSLPPASHPPAVSLPTDQVLLLVLGHSHGPGYCPGHGPGHGPGDHGGPDWTPAGSGRD